MKLQPSATLDLLPSQTVADVPDRLFGSFVEHLGRRVHGGIYEPGHPAADADGPREKRPRRLDPAWGTVETNQYGTDEFMKWCKLAGVLTVFALNRHASESLPLTITAPGASGWKLLDHTELSHADPLAKNSAETPDHVAPKRAAPARLSEGTWHAVLSPASWHVLRFQS